MSPWLRRRQRLDRLAAGLLGLVAAPLVAVLACLARRSSVGPGLIGLVRVGRAGTPFRIWKVRTMVAAGSDGSAGGPPITEAEDPRITPLGRRLRQCRLDELPQLWNVLRGDMSLVGPRPVVPDELNEYGDTRRVLLSVKPGMSGAWAVTGRSRVGYPQRAAVELRYVRRWHLGRDLTILWRTLPTVFTRRGAH